MNSKSRSRYSFGILDSAEEFVTTACIRIFVNEEQYHGMLLFTNIAYKEFVPTDTRHTFKPIILVAP